MKQNSPLKSRHHQVNQIWNGPQGSVGPGLVGVVIVHREAGEGEGMDLEEEAGQGSDQVALQEAAGPTTGGGEGQKEGSSRSPGIP